MTRLMGEGFDEDGREMEKAAAALWLSTLVSWKRDVSNTNKHRATATQDGRRKKEDGRRRRGSDQAMMIEPTSEELTDFYLGARAEKIGHLLLTYGQWMVMIPSSGM